MWSIKAVRCWNKSPTQAQLIIVARPCPLTQLAGDQIFTYSGMATNDPTT